MDFKSPKYDSSFSVNMIMDRIYSVCDKEKKDAVPASVLIEYVKPFLGGTSNSVFSELQFYLDPDKLNPTISSASFFEIMRQWIQTIEEKQKNSLTPPHQSAVDNLMGVLHVPPKSSASPTNLENYSGVLNGSDTPPSYTFSSSAMLENEESKLRQKLYSKIKEVSELKSQLNFYEEQNAELISDLERTNKRLNLEQQINKDLKKTKEKCDESKEEASCYRRENQYLEQKLVLAKQEISSFVNQIEQIESEKEEIKNKLKALKNKENEYQQELNLLKINLLESKEENNQLKCFQKDLHIRIQEQLEMLECYKQSAEAIKCENDALKRSLLKQIKEREEEKLKKCKCNCTTANQNDDLNIKNGILDSSGSEDEFLVVSFAENNTSKQNATNNESLADELEKVGEMVSCSGIESSSIKDFQKLAKEHSNCSKVIKTLQKQIFDLQENIKFGQNSYQNLQIDLQSLKEQKSKYEKEFEILNNERENIVSLNIVLSNENHDLKNTLKSKDQIIEQSRKENETIKTLTEELNNLKLFEKSKSQQLVVLQNKLYKVTLESDSLILKIKRSLAEKNQRLLVGTEKSQKIDKLLHQLCLEFEETKKEVDDLKLKLEQKNSVFCKENENKLTQIYDFLEIEVGPYLTESIDPYLDQSIEAKSSTSTISSLHSTVYYKIDNIMYFINTLLDKMKETSLKLEKIELEYTDLENQIAFLKLTNEQNKVEKSCKHPSFKKQELKIKKLEKTIECLETQTERFKGNENVSSNVMEDHWKNEATNAITNLQDLKYKLEKKDHCIKQFKEEYKKELLNLRAYFERERNNFFELIEYKISLSKNMNIKIEQNIDLRHEELLIKEKNYNELLEKYCVLETDLENCLQEKKRLQRLLEKEENKTISLQKALSDISHNSNDFTDFEKVLEEKESMLKFNRNLLSKNSCNLKMAETKINNLEKVVEECKYLFNSQITELLKVSITTYYYWYEAIKQDDKYTNLQNIEKVRPLQITDTTLDIGNIKKINQEISLVIELLIFLGKTGTVTDSNDRDQTLDKKKSVNKFTLRPPKLILKNESNPGDLKDNNETLSSHQSTLTLINQGTLEHTSKGCDMLDTSFLSNSDASLLLRGNVNMTKAKEQFQKYVQSMKNQEKSIKLRTLSQKEKCTRMRDCCLSNLLQIVKSIKTHHCRQEQSSLVMALNHVDKLKNIIFEAVKLAEQYGALKQHTRTLKFWNFVVNYVTSMENDLVFVRNTFLLTRRKQPKLVDSQQQTSFTTSVQNNENVLDLTFKRHPLRETLGSISKYLLIVFFVYFVLVMYTQWDCLKNGDQFTECPLDSLIRYMVKFKNSPILY